MKKPLALILLFVIILATVLFVVSKSKSTSPATNTNQNNITSFEECVAAGNPVMETYPPQCAANGQTFTQKVDDMIAEAEKYTVFEPDLTLPVSSPIHLTGQVPGTWYFEATFPIELLSADGTTLAEGFAQAEGEWMTEDPVPFTATLEFPEQPAGSTGNLILKKANPSGLPENDSLINYTITF